MYCYNCGKILHEYFEENGHNYCPVCIQNFWPKCSICGRSMNRWIESENGKKYCSDECREKDLPHCCICGKPVTEWITDEDGNIFCSEACFEQILPLCDACGKRMRQWRYTQAGYKFCDDNCRHKIENIMEWYEKNDILHNPLKSYHFSKESEHLQFNLIIALTYLLLSTGISEQYTEIMINKICKANNIKMDFHYCLRKVYTINKNDLDSALEYFSCSENRFYFSMIMLLAMFCDNSYECISSITDILKIFTLNKYELRFLCNRIREQFAV